METFFNSINNRELALLTWLLISLLIVLFSKAFRSFILRATRILLSFRFLAIYFLMFGYLYLILFYINRLGVWDLELLSITIFWLVGVGFAQVFKSIDKDIFYIKKLAFKCFNFTIILEFFINLHVFSYSAELILFPVLLLIGLLYNFSQDTNKYKPINKFLGIILFLTGLVFFIFSIYAFINNFKNDLTVLNFKKLILPVLLTLLFIPFSYLTAVYSNYESLFTSIRYVKSLNYSNKKIKIEIIRFAKINLKSIRKLRTKIKNPDLESTDNLKSYFKTL